MAVANLLFLAVGVAYIFFTLYLANLPPAVNGRSLALPVLLFMAVAGMLGAAFVVLVQAMIPTDLATAAAPELAALPALDRTAALVNFALSLLLSLICALLIALPVARRALQRLIGRSGTFSADSNVHLTGIVLCFALIALNFSSLVLGGGIEGMAETIESTGLSPAAIAGQGLLWIIGAVLGTGIAIRRTLPQVLERLGLHAPSLQDLKVGITAGLGVLALLMVFGLVLSQTMTEEEITEQTAASQEIGLAINSLPFALLVAVAAAVGEEIFFRGALQPVFGLIPTSLLFALIHSQYALTPASLLIFGVALILGWIRKRYSTNAAIVAHFLYNFIQLALALLAGSILSGQ